MKKLFVCALFLVYTRCLKGKSFSSRNNIIYTPGGGGVQKFSTFRKLFTSMAYKIRRASCRRGDGKKSDYQNFFITFFFYFRFLLYFCCCFYFFLALSGALLLVNRFHYDAVALFLLLLLFFIVWCCRYRL